MKTNKYKPCICLTYIGDHGPCPVHGDPFAQHRLAPPRILRVLDDKIIQAMAKKVGVKAEYFPPVTKAE